MSTKTQILQNLYLNVLRREHVLVEVFLVNGVRLMGLIDSFDPYIILLKNSKSNLTQMVYKHAISTIQPSRPVNFSFVDEDNPSEQAEEN